MAQFKLNCQLTRGNKIMSTLFVCHSTGDTNVILDVARELLSNSHDSITILVVGQAAKRKLESLNEGDSLKKSERVNITYLSKIIGEQEMLKSEDDKLSEKQLSLLSEAINKMKISKALIGTPSKNNAQIPFQIAAFIAEHLEVGVIFNDYLFKEQKHIYWNTLTQNDKWQHTYTWCVPLLSTQKELEHTNKDVKSAVVGHPSIEACINTPEQNNSIDAIRKQLGINDETALLFISGTKDLKADQSLLEEIFQARNETENKNIQIRFGLHPGINDLDAYMKELTNHVEQDAAELGQYFKFIITDKLLPRVNLKDINDSLICKADVNGDNGAAAADGVACSVPATLATKSAITGKPAYYSNADKKSYLPADRMFVGKSNISHFFKSLSDKTVKGIISKEELNIPDDSAAKTLASYLIK